LPKIMLTCKNLQGYCKFMIDSGSAINMIKSRSLRNTPIDLNNKLILRSITKIPVETQGAVIFAIAGKVTKFHVVQVEVPIPSDGILGSEFLKINNAILNYDKGSLIIGNMSIPFYNKNEIIVSARTVLPVSFNITNPEKTEGYIPHCELVKGLYLGEALVTNSQGKGHLKVYNVTERDYTIIVKTMHLTDYYSTNLIDSVNSTNFTDFFEFTELSDLTKLSNSTALCYFNKPNINDIIPAIKHRYNKLKNLTNLSHLNEEERRHVETILEKNLDCFFLPGDKLKFSNVTSHSIPTTDNIPIHVKQYRYPPVHKEEIDKQVNKLLENNVIQPSSSPYNAPLWIVPKKLFGEKE